MSSIPREYSTLAYLADEYQDTIPTHTFQADTLDAARAWQEELRSLLTGLLGGFPTDRGALNPRLLAREALADHVRETVVFQSRSNVHVPAYLLIPPGTPPAGGWPALVCLHGHGQDAKNNVAGVDGGDAERREHIAHIRYDYGLQAVRRGYVALVPDACAFGERADTPPQHGSHCLKPALNAFHLGKTLIGLRVWDISRGVDLLQTRSEVNPERIGCLGLSGGGTQALFAPVFEPRLRATVVSGYFCSFRASIFDIVHCACNYVPGIGRHAEMADVAGLIAPRPLFVESGDADPIFPVAAARAEFERLRGIYRVFDAEERLGMDVFPGEHRFNGEKCFDWLARWL